ncbi:MAG: hypothetical protein GX971_10545 [Firmicutes bacterium]|nr:hypothetical protein [Bacillota bacterium]
MKQIEKGGITLNNSNYYSTEQFVSTQTHVHEVQGSTMLFDAIPHNHRFAGMTSEVIPVGDNHIHSFQMNTDFTLLHLHEVGGFTGLAIPVGNGRHIHAASGTSTLNRGHVHEFIFATLIDDPLRM